MSVVENQDEVVAFLSQPGSHGASGPVERIDTHSAMVFLAGRRACKLKRAVRYDYLDFSTPEIRRIACEREVAINRRNAPGLYLGVLAITREAGGRLAFGGTGPPVDYVVQMTRFDQEALFDRLAARGGLTAEVMTDLADAVAAAHARAPARSDHGGRSGMTWVVDGNAEGFGELDDLLDPDLCRRVIRKSREELDRQSHRLEARRTGGCVRECHGDLHLGNIVLLEGRPTLFDAVEFNDRVSCIDTFYDSAFLLMDLWRLHLRSHANQFFNRYVRASGLSALPLLPLFLSCRSAIRAKTGATAARLQSDPARSGELLTAARQYLIDAVEFLHPCPPRLIAIGGLAGSGKSTLAAAMAPAIGAAPGALILRSDVIRKSLFGVPDSQRLPVDAYSETVNRRVYATLAEMATAALASGHAVVADAVFADRDSREAIAGVARAERVPFTGLWLDAPFEVSASRIRDRHGDASDATVDVLAAQHARRPRATDWTAVDASAPCEVVKARAAAILDATPAGATGRR